MSVTSRRKLLSSCFVAFCAGAVILALVPLAYGEHVQGSEVDVVRSVLEAGR